MSSINHHDHGDLTQLATYFAPAARAGEALIKEEIQTVSNNPVVDEVMNAVAGLLAVLNEHRQILTVNDTLLKMLEIDDAAEVLGLRPGEAINCIHAHEQPGGCGTSEFCSTCGAAIAIVTSLAQDKPAQRECVATVRRDGEEVDLYLQVRCCPIRFQGHKFLMLFLQDITIHQQRAALERLFFHDISNTIGALVLNSELLESGYDSSETVTRIKTLAFQLKKEVDIQRVLAHDMTYQITLKEISVEEVFQKVQEIFVSHPVAVDKMLHVVKPASDLQLRTDVHLLQRILVNMLMNAFEASGPGGEVKLWAERTDNAITFRVWNQQVIPEDVARRVFQRNFSTKAEAGRGLGTYAMKLFGETYLKGKVDFTTSETRGTIFSFCLPILPKRNNRGE